MQHFLHINISKPFLFFTKIKNFTCQRVSTCAALSRKHDEPIELGPETRQRCNQSCPLDRRVVALQGLQQALPSGL